MIIKTDKYKMSGLEDTELDIKPITIFYGKNGAGKTRTLDAIMEEYPQHLYWIHQISFIGSYQPDVATHKAVNEIMDDDVPLKGKTSDQGSFRIAEIVYQVKNRDNRIVLIENPEINLHPTVVIKLARKINDLLHLKRKGESRWNDVCVVMTTHSERLIVTFLALVAEGKINTNDIAVYHVTKRPNGQTHYQLQSINSYGQINGGLTSLYEGDMENIQALFGLTNSS